MNEAEFTQDITTPRTASKKDDGGLDDEAFSALLGSIGTMAPLVKSLGGALGGKPSAACAAREHLLLSLKPYLSPARCEAVDYLVRIARLSDIIHSLDKGERRS